MKVVDTENLTKIYHFGDVEVTALNRVNLSISEHEFVAVWGPSGSGKSTFCNVIGLLDTPTDGEVRIREQSVSQLPDAKRSELRNEYIGFVFQNFNLVPVLSALENVMLPLQIQGVSQKDAKVKAMALLEEVELLDRMEHRPQKLSGGQQQRVAIARALVTDPLLVIADEPTANLDTKSANLIVNLMRKINETRGAAFVFSTHDDRLLVRVDRKIHLQDGMVVEDTGSTTTAPPGEEASTVQPAPVVVPAASNTAESTPAAGGGNFPTSPSNSPVPSAPPEA
jgi:putative ABC transport system ATP-binding protein